MYLVYILKSDNRSYIGMTNDFFKRWKQHNKIIKGGAKYTSKYDNWSPICIVDGFKTKSEAMQCEWKLKRVKGYYNRICNLSKILQNDEVWTKKSPLISSQNLTIYTVNSYKHLFKINTKELYWL
jgi:predicted GIY-YIG superfamily endonuclease